MALTLTPITEPEKLDEYYRFRYRIYSDSGMQRFVIDAGGLDKNPFDERARHYGWYVDGTLAGCVRFIEPDGSAVPIPTLAVLNGGLGTAVRSYVAEREALSQPMAEASRFCLAQAYRGLRTTREFVLAMVATMQPLGYEHGVFNCRQEHSQFYRTLGFDPLHNGGGQYVPCLEETLVVFQCDFAKLVGKNARLRELISSFKK
ncbi:MAG: GNAT family N-acyltransferase [Flavobacteriales bacterium]